MMSADPTEPSHDRIDGPQTMPVDPTGWWETERAAFVRARVAALAPAGSTIIDVGCGRGDMLDHPGLADRVRVNVDSHIWDEWRGRDDMLFVAARADALPFRDGAFDLVGSFDVLEHIPDDTTALVEQQRIARERAHVVAAVPADPKLWSAHDVAVGHQRRYTIRSFTDLVDRTDLVLQRRSYFFSFLWLPAWAARNTHARTREPADGTGFVSRLIRALIGLLAAGERLVLRRVTIPFGTSAWFEMRTRAAGDARRPAADVDEQHTADIGR